MQGLRLLTAIVTGLVAVGLSSVAMAQPQPQLPQPVTPSVAVDPNQVGATPHWTITLGAAYCGGYRIGDGVYVSPEPPLALPPSLSDDSTLFSGQPAIVAWVNGVLRVGPAPGLARSMICMPGPRPLNVELLPAAGFSLPTDPGDYALDVWTGADPTPINLAFSLPPPDDTAPDPTD